MRVESERTFSYWLFWLVLVAMVLVFPGFVWHENTSGFLTDDGMYLLLADFFSPFHERNVLVERLVIDQSRFPPAFPVLIGLLGGGSQNMHVAHLVTCATFIASAVVFYAWAERTLGSREVAAACLAIYALLPKTLTYVLEIWSEYLYMTFVFAALILMDVYKRSEHHAHHALLACALLTGLTLLTRTIGVALLAVFLLFLFVHRVGRKLYYISIALTLPVFWEVVKTISGYGGSYSEDLTQYTSWKGALTLLFSDIPTNAYLLFQAWGEHFAVPPEATWFLRVLGVLLLGLAAIGGVDRAIRKCPDFYYLAAYVSIVLVWPHSNHISRFLYPLIPIALVYAFAGSSILARPWKPGLRSWASTGLSVLILAMIVPNVLFVVGRFYTPMPQHISQDYRHTREWLSSDPDWASRHSELKDVIVKLMGRIDEHIAPYECVYAVHPVSTVLYSDRRAIMLPQQASIDKLRLCDYLFVMNLVGMFDANYPLGEIDGDKLALLDMQSDSQGRPQAFLFRIQR